MLLLGIVLGVIALAVWLFLRTVESDSPEVAETRGNLKSYARQQHRRAESMAALLRDIRAQDDVMPSLSAELRERLDRELKP